jgi:hypothetical protein
MKKSRLLGAVSAPISDLYASNALDIKVYGGGGIVNQLDTDSGADAYAFSS